ncbi:MAG: LysR family transcriptional regulator [Peptococcaceae bacterium]|jgi:DNA-binding transcriptional LysR family regulator|nr:LysR family transcriptional regulator [Peptococcaceae bacterium]
MTTNRLQEFLVLADTRSYSLAAKKLYITQSVLSRHILEMEEELGFKLFVRSTRAMCLTEAGKQLSLDAARLIQKCAKLESRIKIGGQTDGGTLKIACTRSSLGRGTLDFIHRFSARYRGIALSLSVARGPVTSREILENDVFLSPCAYTQLLDKIKCSAAFRQAAFVAFPAGRRLQKSPFVELKELEKENLFVPFDDEFWGPYAQNRILAEKHTNGRINVIPVPNVDSALLMVSLGNGVTIVPKSVVSGEYRNIALSQVTTVPCAFDVNMYYCDPADNPSVRVFVDEAANGEGAPNPGTAGV